MRNNRTISVSVVTGFLLATASCGVQKHAAVTKVNPSKTLLTTTDRGWLQFKIYQLPTEDATTKHAKQKQPLLFSIMIVNAQDNTGPLRKISANLQQYNVLYEYLLNQVKNDLALVSGTEVLYPTYCSFENNYNVFPFETLNVGFSAEALSRYKIKKSVPVSLLYADKIFSHDTLTCDITHVM